MIRFSSEAAGNVDMLDAHAQQLLDALGKPRDRGVITPDEIPAALARLRAAVQQDRAQAAPPPEDTDDPEERERREQQVDLGRRAYPLIDMLERAAGKRCNVTWGI